MSREIRKTKKDARKVVARDYKKEKKEKKDKAAAEKVAAEESPGRPQPD